MSKSKFTKMITIRLPTTLYDDLKIISSTFAGLSMSSLIILATCKDIIRYKEILKNGNCKTDIHNNL